MILIQTLRPDACEDMRVDSPQDVNLKVSCHNNLADQRVMISNVCLITLLLHLLACNPSDLSRTSTRVFLISLGLLNFSQNSGVAEIFGQIFLYFAI